MDADKTSICHIEYDDETNSWVCIHCKDKFTEVRKPPKTTALDIAVPLLGAAAAFFLIIVVPIIRFR